METESNRENLFYQILTENCCQLPKGIISLYLGVFSWSAWKSLIKLYFSTTKLLPQYGYFSEVPFVSQDLQTHYNFAKIYPIMIFIS